VRILGAEGDKFVDGICRTLGDFATPCPSFSLSLSLSLWLSLSLSFIVKPEVLEEIEAVRREELDELEEGSGVLLLGVRDPLGFLVFPDLLVLPLPLLTVGVGVVLLDNETPPSVAEEPAAEELK